MLVGDVIAWWILTDNTKQVIPHSMVQSSLDPHNLILCAMSPAVDDPLGIMNDNSFSLDGKVQPTTTFNVLSMVDLITSGLIQQS